MAQKILSIGHFWRKTVCKVMQTFSCYSDTQTADIVLECAMFKNCDGAMLGNKLKSLIALLKVLPVSLADC